MSLKVPSLPEDLVSPERNVDETIDFHSSRTFQLFNFHFLKKRGYRLSKSSNFSKNYHFFEKLWPKPLANISHEFGCFYFVLTVR